MENSASLTKIKDYSGDNAEEFFSDLSTLNEEIGRDYNFEDVEMDSDTEAEDTQSEDLDATMRSIQKLTFLLGKNKGLTEGRSATVKIYGEVIDDFVRNFLVLNGCVKTVECFETEWYDLKEKGKLLDSQLEQPPDEYTRSLQVQEVLARVEDQLQQATVLAHCRQEMTEKFRKERNMHRMHHNRIAQEKNKLIMDIKRLRCHYAKYEPIITALRKKYESVLRAKAMITIERDRLQALVDEAGLNKLEDKVSVVCKETIPEQTPMYMGKPDALIMVRPDRRTIIDNTPKPSNVKKFTLRRTFRGHSVSVSNIVVHPKKPVVVTASDDATWRMWGLPAGDLIMTGDGHKDWVAGLSFHPRFTTSSMYLNGDDCLLDNFRK